MKGLANLTAEFLWSYFSSYLFRFPSGPIFYQILHILYGYLNRIFLILVLPSLTIELVILVSRLIQCVSESGQGHLISRLTRIFKFEVDSISQNRTPKNIWSCYKSQNLRSCPFPNLTFFSTHDRSPD